MPLRGFAVAGHENRLIMGRLMASLVVWPALLQCQTMGSRFSFRLLCRFSVEQTVDTTRKTNCFVSFYLLRVLQAQLNTVCKVFSQRTRDISAAHLDPGEPLVSLGSLGDPLVRLGSPGVLQPQGSPRTQQLPKASRLFTRSSLRRRTFEILGG